MGAPRHPDQNLGGAVRVTGGDVITLAHVGVHEADGVGIAVGNVADGHRRPAQSVAKPLGSTTMTFTPNVAVSARSTRENPSMANFAAW